MKIMVTGASGYIGARLVKHLASSGAHEVTALLRPSSSRARLEAAPGPVAIAVCPPTPEGLQEVLERTRPEVVVHLAASTLSAPRADQVEELLRANIVFGTLLVEAMVHSGVRALVNTGTFWEQGDGTGDYHPVNLYAATKRAFRDILQYYGDAAGLHYITLRLHGVYGPHDPRRKIFTVFRESMTSAEPLPVSPGEQLMDLVHVDDVAAAYECAARYVHRPDSTSGLVIPIGSGKGRTLREIADIYQECCGARLNLKWGGIPYRDREVLRGVADPESARSILHWKPRLDLRAGIRNMLAEEGLAPVAPSG